MLFSWWWRGSRLTRSRWTGRWWRGHGEGATTGRRAVTRRRWPHRLVLPIVQKYSSWGLMPGTKCVTAAGWKFDGAGVRIGAGKPRPIGCGCGRKLMVATVQLARMSCTQRQRSGGAARDEAHIGGRRAVGWSGVVGIVCGCGSGRTRNVMVAVVQLPWTSCHVCWHMHCIPLTARSSSRENMFQRYHFSDKILEISLVFTHGFTLARANHNKCFVKKCILMFPAMHGHLTSYRRRPHGHLAAGCATDPNSIFFRRLGAPDAVHFYKM